MHVQQLFLYVRWVTFPCSFSFCSCRTRQINREKSKLELRISFHLLTVLFLQNNSSTQTLKPKMEEEERFMNVDRYFESRLLLVMHLPSLNTKYLWHI